MTMHLFGSVLTAKAVAPNNRGENEGTVSTLQKIIRSGDIYSTVSAEAIRYALRETWQIDGDKDLNRTVSHTGSEWKDPKFEESKRELYIDNDVLGFMNPKAETDSRRGRLEITRAVSTLPWMGTVSSQFASIKSNSALMNKDQIPYQAEVHDTRYQYSFAMTPADLYRDNAARAEKTLLGIQNLRRVAGNHAHFLYDFSPEVIVLRWTHDPAPRMLLCFDEDERGNISLERLLARVQGGDVDSGELVVGCVLAQVRGLAELESLGVKGHRGVKAAFDEVVAKVKASLPKK
jgi:CRISPR-associated protein Cst2